MITYFESDKTEKLGTDTDDGWYDHVKFNSGSAPPAQATILAPIKLDFETKTISGKKKPLRRGDKVVYALPGGAEFELPDPGGRHFEAPRY